MAYPRFTALAVIQREGAAGRDFLVQCADEADFYRFPGGAVEFGETAAQTIAREMQEEYGLAVEVGELWMVNENFFTHEGQTGHSVSLLHYCTCESAVNLVELRHQEHDNIRLVWRCEQELRESGRLMPEGIAERLGPTAEGIFHLISGAENSE